jgi:septal ring factor EnvC (AmiA/AmiB activator)
MTDRNKWDTAIRCLEVALHPHTIDDEVIAAVNGFRRTAEGATLREVCLAFAARAGGAPADGTDAARWRAELARLERAIQELHRRNESEASRRATILSRLAEARRQNRALADELAAMTRRAAAAERDLADLRNAARSWDAPRPRDESSTVRAPATSPARPPAARFQELLATARLRTEFVPRPALNTTIGVTQPRTPWTA